MMPGIGATTSKMMPGIGAATSNHLTTITAAKDWPGILMKVNKTSSTYSHWYRSVPKLGKSCGIIAHFFCSLLIFGTLSSGT